MADTVKSIFRQRKVAGKYVTDLFGETYLKKTDKVIADDVIGEYDIDIPLLEKNEEFFLADIMQIVVIKKRLRSSDGSITYYVEDEIVELKIKRRSLKRCMMNCLENFVIIKENISIRTNSSTLDQIKHRMIGTEESNLSTEIGLTR